MVGSFRREHVRKDAERLLLHPRQIMTPACRVTQIDVTPALEWDRILCFSATSFL